MSRYEGYMGGGSAESYQCPECKQFFKAGHFCTGKPLKEPKNPLLATKPTTNPTGE